MDRIPDTVTDPTTRQEFVYLFDVDGGNPNGDPDAANAPRQDPQTGHGLVSDVSLKRKVRDFLMVTQGKDMFIQSETALNTLKKEAADKLDPPLSADEKKGKKPIRRLQERLVADYYDIRMFGAVLATGEGDARFNAGQVRGPVQLVFGRSIEPIHSLDQALTRQARTTEARMATGPTEFGRKWIVPYALYRAHGFINPFLAEQRHVAKADLEAFWTALCNMFEFDRSASRGEMSVRGLYVFTHDNKLGRARASTLFDLIRVIPSESTSDNGAPSRAPRGFADYDVQIDRANLPQGVTLTRLVG